MVKKKLIHYGGEGYGYSKENGYFVVKTGGTNKAFRSLSKAREYFNSLDEPKFIWDLSGAPELLDAYDYAN